MTSLELKNMLLNTKNIQIHCNLLKSHLDKFPDNSILHQYQEKRYQLDLLYNLLELLDDIEYFVIYNHLILHYSWSSLEKMYSSKYGHENERSERTLKRIQNRALSKMVSLINSSEPIQQDFKKMLSITNSTTEKLNTDF